MTGITSTFSIILASTVGLFAIITGVWRFSTIFRSKNECKLIHKELNDTLRTNVEDIGILKTDMSAVKQSLEWIVAHLKGDFDD